MAALLVACAAFSVSVKYELRRDRSPIATLVLDQPMPDFTLKDTSGADVTLSQVIKEHKLVAINFWASWCGPCRIEMPGFDKLYQELNKDGFVILGINEDDRSEAMTQYLARKPVSFPILIDADGALMARLKVRALPTTILVGDDGRILEVHEGLEPFFSSTVRWRLEAANKK
jgi:peroxiredoxin